MRTNETSVKRLQSRLEPPQVVATRSVRTPPSGSEIGDCALSRIASDKAASPCEAILAAARELLVSHQEYTRGVMVRALRLWMTPWRLTAVDATPVSADAPPAPVQPLEPAPRERPREASKLPAVATPARAQKRVRATRKAPRRHARKRVVKRRAPGR